MKRIFILIVGISIILFSAISTAKNILVYSSIQPSFWQIYLLKDKEKPIAFTSGSSLNYNPTFSPDGKWIVYTSEKTGTGFLYIINSSAPKSAGRRLTQGNAYEDAAAFSPDGKWIYYVSTRDGTANIFKIPFNPKSTISQNKAVNITNNDSGNFNPAVSPDGNWIAFSSNREASATLITNPQPPSNYRATNIYIMKTDGSELKKLTNENNWQGSPTWSADGNTIFFYGIKTDIPRIYKMDRNGTNIVSISPENIPALSPTLAPDKRIAFTAKINNKWNIVSCKEDGTDFRQETNGDRDYWAPAYDNNNHLLAYGQGAQEKDVFYAEVLNGPYLSKPMGIGPFLINERNLQTDDANLDVYAVRGYFPMYIPSLKKIASVKEFSRVVLANPDGSNTDEIMRAKDGYMIGLTATKDGNWFATAIGMPFSATDNSNIWKFNKTGQKKNLNEDEQTNNTFPRFTADGKHIVFRSAKAGSKNIYIMDTKGGNIKQLTFDNSIDTMPAVSPTGDKIIFASARNGENYKIYLLEIKSDGTPGELTKLTDGPWADVHPFFSPDGKWIAFASERGGLKDETPLNPIFSPQPYGDVYLMRLSDKKIVPVTDNKWEDSLPNWVNA